MEYPFNAIPNVMTCSVKPSIDCGRRRPHAALQIAFHCVESLERTPGIGGPAVLSA